MDLRVIKYFLAVASEGNITKAAEIMHVTQPTLSRQLMDLENEMGTQLFTRGKRNVTLTAAGTLFQQTAREIVALLEKTQRDMMPGGELVAGTIAIGCVETVASRLLPKALEAFYSCYPLVKYEIFSANGDGIREKLDGGQIDVGILVEPIEVAKYDFIRLNYQDRWGVLMRRDNPLADRDSISIEDIKELPLFMSIRRIVTDEIESWLGERTNNLNIIAYHNLLTNTILLIEHGLGCAVVTEGAFTLRPTDELRFVPFSPERKAGHVLAWKKNRVFGQAASLFIEHIKNNYQHT